MTGMFRFAQISTVFVFTFVLASSHTFAQSETQNGPMRPVERLALLGDEYRTAIEAVSPAIANEPVPFTISTMANDTVPPFAGFPTLTPIPASTETGEQNVSFEENMPAEKAPQKSVDSIDDCCRELTEMISGNLDSEISLDAKKRMIETALKMVARNVALKAEAKITKLKADHALQMARMQGQMGQMRSSASAADQINRVAGPLSTLLNRNYQQAAAMNMGNERLSQSLAQLGYQRLEEEARVARANRQHVIRLTSPVPAPLATAQSRTPQEPDNQWQIDEITQQLAQLQRQLEARNNQRSTHQNVRSVGYNQPLQPRRQPLEPLQRRQTNSYFDANQHQQIPQLPRTQR